MNNDEDFDNAPERGIIEILIEELQRQTGVVIREKNLNILKENISMGSGHYPKPTVTWSPTPIGEPNIHGKVLYVLYDVIENNNQGNEVAEWTQTYGAIINAFKRLNKNVSNEIRKKSENDINKYVAHIMGRSTQQYSLIGAKTLEVKVSDSIIIYKTEPLVIVPGVWSDPVYRAVLEDWRKHNSFAEMKKQKVWSDEWKDKKVIGMDYFEMLMPKGK
ncbi:hypothetical protein HN695_04915 [Candidatus Woesearchaeota archaeon]|jgi:hypothetical protein|nr:hypothetical protein [Candidatus Woesearchaeota archaeon]MBT5272065.1 hypothetical protein [Candidatus Woesearchaeota archaeon]MBT6041815.1 hypothetical protein [Candidatus Woesearchaeota archaeon]MBT6336810.1 hypothetical protein [Candidatus Woesearchaeota archaeon]MBT7927655.1 hypothetical protein [Candidatus Woesearchaeota archaeon]